MRYVAAYLLAALGGNDNPEAKDIKKILDSVGIEADDTRLNKVVSELKGKNVNEVIATGYSKLASVPAGGAVAVASSAGAGSGGAAAPAAAVEEKKEEKKEESEESDDDMGFEVTLSNLISDLVCICCFYCHRNPNALRGVSQLYQRKSGDLLKRRPKSEP
ncbi:hypothetical protein ATANTOWER_029465 [Ataeniobius toweri]|uniref:Large ribosomal subunit protein P2 n=1 Tax=Ataeniobius toweri TaxID=208326 RepID=A0ABU7AKP8_9TELE|nr:hypothetical protein [Ataeniobius toweri]